LHVPDVAISKFGSVHMNDVDEQSHDAHSRFSKHDAPSGEPGAQCPELHVNPKPHDGSDVPPLHPVPTDFAEWHVPVDAQ
jgi:hypothetical protein